MSERDSGPVEGRTAAETATRGGRGAEGGGPEGPTSIGPDANLLAAIGYIVPILGLIFFVIEEDNDFVRFHGLQAIAAGVTIYLAGFVLSFVFVLLVFLPGFLYTIVSLLSNLIWLGVFLAMLYLAYQAYEGERIEIPVIGDFVTQQL